MVEFLYHMIMMIKLVVHDMMKLPDTLFTLARFNLAGQVMTSSAKLCIVKMANVNGVSGQPQPGWPTWPWPPLANLAGLAGQVVFVKCKRKVITNYASKRTNSHFFIVCDKKSCALSPNLDNRLVNFFKLAPNRSNNKNVCYHATCEVRRTVFLLTVDRFQFLLILLPLCYYGWKSLE